MKRIYPKSIKISILTQRPYFQVLWITSQAFLKSASYVYENQIINIGELGGADRALCKPLKIASRPLKERLLI
jgi:hypothetical protein